MYLYTAVHAILGFGYFSRAEEPIIPIFYDFDHPIDDVFLITLFINTIAAYLRFFSYWRIFKCFSKEVGLVVITTKKTLIFLLIIFYFFMCFTIMSQIINHTSTFSQNFVNMYIWLILGGAEDDHFSEFPFVEMIIIIGSIFITIILLNILIAFLSNVFSRLEEEQEINLIREQAAMILDVEVMIYFFKHVCFKKRQRKKKDLYSDSHHETLVKASIEELKVFFYFV
jgi:hypothetical protein